MKLLLECPVLSLEGLDQGFLKGTAVRAASVTNISLDIGLQAGDGAGGVLLAEGDIFGAFGQTDATENGVYVVQAEGLPQRHASFDTWDKIAGATFPVREGVLAGSIFQNANTSSGVIGTDPLEFVAGPVSGPSLGMETGTFTPTWTADVSPPSLGNGSITGEYVKIGRMVLCTVVLTMGSTTTFGAGSFRFGVPFPAPVASGLSGFPVAGDDAGTGYARGMTIGGSPTAFIVVDMASGNGWGATTPHTWAVNDRLSYTFSYLAAS